MANGRAVYHVIRTPLTIDNTSRTDFHMSNYYRANLLLVTAYVFEKYKYFMYNL